VLLVGGGTGGHVSPLLAITEALREADPEVRFLFLGGRRGLEGRLVPAAGIPFHATPLPSLRDPESRVAFITSVLRVPLAFVDALVRIAIFKPGVCCTSGGFVAIPIALAARALRVPVYLWEGNAIPGRANRLLAAWCARVGVSFDQARRWLPAKRAVLTGTPIRQSILRWTRDAGRQAFAIPETAALVTITGGSQGSEKVNDAVFGALARVLPKAHLLHVTGESSLAKAEAKRATLPAHLQAKYIVRARLGDEMGAALAAADLVVGRAGASSIAEPLALGVPCVLIPLGVAMDAHQDANARSAVEAGAAASLRESELDSDRLTAVVTGLLQDTARLQRMSSAARAAGRPDAARTIAADLRAIGGCA
jgi:UDP-N-acetylglucosamine--N-acetylmuramyl-(pentapeptide) pyrophosphoryl-undecaprenol N-acetylglucosamine transferase